MGYQARYTGEITINPPLTWEELDGIGSPVITLTDVRIRCHDEDASTPTARVTIITGVAVVAAASLGAGYDMVADLQALLDTFGAERFTGHIEATGEDGDKWRLAIRDGKAIQVHPKIVWPGEDSDG